MSKNPRMQILSSVGARSAELWPFYINILKFRTLNHQQLCILDVFKAWDYARTISRSKKLHIACPKTHISTKTLYLVYFWKSCMYVNHACMLCVFYVCTICMYYMYSMYVLYVCSICMYYMYVVYVCSICVYYMNVSYVSNYVQELSFLKFWSFGAAR